MAQQRPDLILMDIQLPGVDGLELTRAIRRLPQFAATKIVAITSYEASETEKRALAAGCDGFIAKPIDINTFPPLVASFLQAG